VHTLRARWDWDAIDVSGDVHVHAPVDLSQVTIPAESRDRLVEGGGHVVVNLDGADFQFVEKMTIGGLPLEFTLPGPRRGGPVETMSFEIDTAALKPGQHKVVVTQAGRKTSEIGFRILPAPPKPDGFPLRVNAGESQHAFTLRGTGLDRIERLTSDLAEFELDRSGKGTLRLRDGRKAGDRGPVLAHLDGVSAPVRIENGIEILPPRPRGKLIAASRADDLPEGELPAGSFSGFLLEVDGGESLEARCGGREVRVALGERQARAKLERSAPGRWFFSVDPGVAGCELVATVAGASGRSDPVALGRVVRLPRIESLSADGAAIVLRGQDLDVIAKAGWDANAASA
ncbi:MAG: hypothetical protein ACRD96_25235, partial [Bryobacteraceae bacterium]